MIQSKGNFVGGKWRQSMGSPLISSSPVSGEVVWEGRASGAEDVDAAVAAAVAASSSWAGASREERAAIIRSFSQLVKDNAQELATLISQEVGKPLWESKQEVASVAGKYQPTADSFEARAATIVRPFGAGSSVTRFKPHGVVAVIGPYNFPAHMANGHIVPALLAGNTVIFKPSEFGPSVAEFTITLWERAGLPPGVLNLLQGDGVAGARLVEHPDVRAVFFTGSRSVGERIITACAGTKMHALEMGGNSPLVVWDAPNLRDAAILAVQSAFITAGQRCSSARRVIVPMNAFGDSFLEEFVSLASRLRVGTPFQDPEPYMGPLRRPDQVDDILEFQASLVSRGARTLLTSRRLAYGECFVTPGIVDVTTLGSADDVEVIGPLVQVSRVGDFASALKSAADTRYGLAAGIVTGDERLYSEFQRCVPAGLINWNQQLTGASGAAPFGGIRASGNHRPSGNLAVDYCVYATASIEVPALPALELPTGVAPE